MKHYADEKEYNGMQKRGSENPVGRHFAPDPDEPAKAEPAKKADTDRLNKDGTKRPRTDVPATPIAPVPKMKAGYAPAFIFAGFILVMMGWFVYNTVSYFSNGTQKEYEPSEKRILADFPKLTADNSTKTGVDSFLEGYETVSSGKFGKEFETFFADHFPARKF